MEFGRWEYAVWCPDSSWSPERSGYIVDGQAFSNQVDVMNLYGSQGWELVGVTDRPSVFPPPGMGLFPEQRVTTLYFKRRR